jgi:serine/threonine-protein kinase HipA
MDFDLYHDGGWQRCASVSLLDPAVPNRRGAVRLQYEADYAIEHLQARDLRALTVRVAVDLGVRDLKHWPSFLIDLLPQGAARRRIERLNNGALNDWQLLERGAVNPVGNLRVRPTAPRSPQRHRGFELKELLSRGDSFVDYAHEVGATVAGATDTQGEAPKFWVVEDEQGRWHPDSGALGFPVRRYFLLKFPVPEAGEYAREILYHEAAYQRIAQRLGLRVTEHLPEVAEGALLIPRFDRRFVNGREVRLGVESLYSVTGVLDSAASAMRHHEALIALAECVDFFESELLEYVRRDLLNIALGNRDNHGRNTAVLKDTDGSMRLAPLYDLGPAFLDARSLVRVIRWDGENAVERDWNHVLSNLAVRFAEAGQRFSRWALLSEAMREFALTLDQLPALMSECGVTAHIVVRRREEIARLARELRAIRTA